mgnify:FL=1
MDRFRSEGYPFSVAVLDMDWHKTDLPPEYGRGWTVYSWNRDLFPDPARFLGDLHRRGLHSALNLHPADGVQAYEDAYRDMAVRMGMDPACGDPVRFDAASLRHWDAYFSCLIYPQEDAAIREAWQRYRESGGADAVRMQCLVTGTEDEIAAVHPSVKGVRDAQSSGAALVSFNAPAFCSYGHEQNFNAPVGKYAAFAYTAALNHLLADKENVQTIGDTTVICWAEGAEDIYQTFGVAALFGGGKAGLSDDDLRAALKRLANGLPCDDLGIDPNRPFYILGLAPNAARLSVRFFLRDSFGALMKNVNDHYERMEIVRPAYEKFTYLPLWALLRETVNLNSRDKVPSPSMAGATARAIFSGGRYPASLLETTMLRIRAERHITWGRAAIIKAYYLKNPHEDCPKEVLTVSLNEASTDTAYTLGRLFSVYEAVQQTANPGINATIKDKYFNSAAAMPASIFPVLNNLYQKHLRKLEGGQRVYYDKQVMALKGILGESYPARMTLAQQGAFDLGYYHQTQKRFTKKEEENNV